MNMPDPVRFKLQAPRDRWTGLRTSGFRARVDLSGPAPAFSPRQSSLRRPIPRSTFSRLFLHCLRAPGRGQGADGPGQGEPGGQRAIRVCVWQARVDPEVVVVSGPSSLVQWVDTASVDVRLDGITVDIDQAFQHVQLPVQQQVSYKQVGIRPTLSGNPATGYWIESVTSEPPSVTAVGDPKALAGIDFLETAPLNVADAASSLVQDVRVVTAEGVSLVQQQQTVRLRANIIPMQVSQIVRVAPRVVNLDPRLRVLGVPSFYDVTVQGAAPWMQAANVDNISVILDVAGLGEGTVTVRPACCPGSRAGCNW